MIVIGIVWILVKMSLDNDDIENIKLVLYLLCLSTGEIVILICLIIKTSSYISPLKNKDRA